MSRHRGTRGAKLYVFCSFPFSSLTWVLGFSAMDERYSDLEYNAQAAMSMVQQALLLAMSEEGSASNGRKKQMRGPPPQVVKAKFYLVPRGQKLLASF